MRIRKLVNTSATELEVEYINGIRTTLPSGQILENVQVSEKELNKVRPHVRVTFDLTEVKGLLD
jgi:hypothetical protein